MEDNYLVEAYDSLKEESANLRGKLKNKSRVNFLKWAGLITGPLCLISFLGFVTHGCIVAPPSPDKPVCQDLFRFQTVTMDAFKCPKGTSLSKDIERDADNRPLAILHCYCK